MIKDSVRLPADQENFDFLEEKVLLHAYHSSDALKDEIGRIITHRRKSDWDFVNIISKGPFIYLRFKHKNN